MNNLKKMITTSLFVATLIVGAGGAYGASSDTTDQSSITILKKDPGTVGS
ncbi:hypothetical protein [Bacillus sp. ISL-57]|nr:hypothetical protein [Bacillus sp. ISL-57]MBT2718304.1 hypothetical protein [Bacillus sp. ISL-57]